MLLSINHFPLVLPTRHLCAKRSTYVPVLNHFLLKSSKLTTSLMARADDHGQDLTLGTLGTIIRQPLLFPACTATLYAYVCWS